MLQEYDRSIQVEDHKDEDCSRRIADSSGWKRRRSGRICNRTDYRTFKKKRRGSTRFMRGMEPYVFAANTAVIRKADTDGRRQNLYKDSGCGSSDSKNHAAFRN